MKGHAMNCYTVSFRSTCLSIAFALLALPASAAWTVTTSGTSPVVTDGDLVTGQGPGSALLFALVVLQSLVGDTITQKVARGMVTNVLG